MFYQEWWNVLLLDAVGADRILIQVLRRCCRIISSCMDPPDPCESLGRHNAANPDVADTDRLAANPGSSRGTKGIFVMMYRQQSRDPESIHRTVTTNFQHHTTLRYCHAWRTALSIIDAPRPPRHFVPRVALPPNLGPKRAIR